jgi:LysR family nitrogen assimilation transcriptional regulator
LGPYAIAAASKDHHLQSSKLVDPVVPRHIALAMSRHGNLTLACRTVMQMTQDIAKSGVAALRAGEPDAARLSFRSPIS